MREFNARSGTLYRLPPAAKALYGGYLALTVAGFLTSIAIYAQRMGASPATWYLGNASDPAATEILVAKSTAELLDTTHFHLFTVPVAMLVLGHLFLLSRGGAWKGWVVAAAVALSAAHVAGPWIIHYGGPSYGWVMPVTGVPFLAVYLVMALWPVPDLLRGPPA